MKKILMVAVESKPYATAGGTSDVVSALSRLLRQKGHDVRLVLPYYRAAIQGSRYDIDHVMDVDVTVGSETRVTLPESWPPSLKASLRIPTEPIPTASVYQVSRSTPDPDGEDDPAYLIGSDPYRYFARVEGKEVPIYPPLEEQSVQPGKLYAFFCRAVLEMARRFAEQGWKPDVIHCHDWPTGLLPAYLKSIPRNMIGLEGIKVVFTVHNISDVVYQGGWFDPEVLQYADIPRGLFSYGWVQHNHHVNFIKAGIVFADAVNTVSEGYAREIQESATECFMDLEGERRHYQCSGGLDYVWSQYNVNLVGIRNGIDATYDPTMIGQGADWQLVDADWQANYAPAEGQSISGWAYSGEDPHFRQKKRGIKRYLQERCNRILGAAFELSEDIPVIAVRSRLVEQKGFDLILRALKQWDLARRVQFVVVAWGEDRYAARCRQELEDLAEGYPDRLAFSRSWRDVPEPLHYAGADLLLMPSLFEPCGLPHMMALQYGTVPVVRRTGGLADVVGNFDLLSGTGNGFDFVAPDHREMLEAVERALLVYQSPAHWQTLVNNAIRARDRNGRDFSWESSVDCYIASLYE